MICRHSGVQSLPGPDISGPRLDMSGQSQTYLAFLVCLALNDVNQSLIFPRTLTSCCLALLSWSHPRRFFLLKVMAHEGHARRSKHREEAGDSSSWAPSSQPKTLTKHQRPITLREESSPKDSPPRGGTPDSPEEYECLKIRPPVAHTNREVINYNKVDPRNIITLCDKACYN
jgi:hypothetical protein